MVRRVEQALTFVLMAGLTAWFFYGLWSAFQPPSYYN